MDSSACARDKTHRQTKQTEAKNFLMLNKIKYIEEDGEREKKETVRVKRRPQQMVSEVTSEWT